MPIHRLNHAVLYVRDAEVTASFYEGVLGFERLPMGFPGAPCSCGHLARPTTTTWAFSRSGERAQPSAAGRGSVGLYHLAWEVSTLEDLEDLSAKLSEAGALVGASDHGTTKSLYAKDPDGIEFEVAWVVPADQLDEAALASRSTIGRLDLEREKSRYGASTLGGIGISR